jgi:replicative DNA helicase
MSPEDQLQPNSIESEQAVLGGLLVGTTDENSLDEVFEKLKAKDFYRQDHQKIYEAIGALHQKGSTIDVLTVGEHLKRTKLDKETGGTSYLGELASNAPVAINSLVYANLVRERAVHRSLMEVGSQIGRLGSDPQARNIAELIEEAEKTLFELSQQQSHKKTFSAIAPLLEKITLKVDNLSNIDSYITGFATGYSRFDDITSGLQRGDLIIIAGRPSMGKTTLAVNIAEYVANHNGDYLHTEKYGEQKCVVGVFSMEMGADQLVMRILSAKGSIPLKNIRTGKISNEEWESLLSSGAQLKEKSNIFIDDSSGISVHTLRGRARRLKKDNPTLGLIVIDYLQLLNIDRRLDNRTAEVTEISRILKEMARELEVPVIVLSQLNRMVENRKDRRPMMSDLRESGSIEQDADIVLFIHRPEVYEPENENLKGRAEAFLSKHRNGETGIIKLNFEGQYSRFSNPFRDDSLDSDLETQAIPIE